VAIEIAPRIVVDKAVRFGKPVIKGTRVDVAMVLGHLSAGDTVEDVMRQYNLTREDVLAALAYAAEIVASEEVGAVD
jgi:uncharacterized protein (DUF433 family)